MKKENLLSIGELSKITGVHIKSLRYYDSLGILNPEYVDPDSGYRYYSFSQKAIVEAIQFCIEFGVPLKQFNAYTNDKDCIFYFNLVQDGTRLLEERLKRTQNTLNVLKVMQAEMNRSEISYIKKAPDLYTLPARTCWLTPYDGELLSDEATIVSKKCIMEIHKKGFQIGNSYGQIYLRKEEQWKKFFFIDIRISAKGFSDTLKQDFPILQIPAGDYYCNVVEQSGLKQAKEWVAPYASEKQIQFILETELFIGQYDFKHPILEQRCFIG